MCCTHAAFTFKSLHVVCSLSCWQFISHAEKTKNKMLGATTVLPIALRFFCVSRFSFIFVHLGEMILSLRGVMRITMFRRHERALIPLLERCGIPIALGKKYILCSAEGKNCTREPTKLNGKKNMKNI